MWNTRTLTLTGPNAQFPVLCEILPKSIFTFHITTLGTKDRVWPVAASRRRRGTNDIHWPNSRVSEGPGWHGPSQYLAVPDEASQLTLPQEHLTPETRIMYPAWFGHLPPRYRVFTLPLINGTRNAVLATSRVTRPCPLSSIQCSWCLIVGYVHGTIHHSYLLLRISLSILHYQLCEWAHGIRLRLYFYVLAMITSLLIYRPALYYTLLETLSLLYFPLI